MTDELFDVHDRRVLITGASLGIGLHLTELFLSRGAKVFSAARSAESSKPLRALQREYGPALTTVPMDVSDSESMRRALASVLDTGQVDVLVNNAGVSSKQPILAEAHEEWERVLSTNLAGPVHLSSAVAADLVARNKPGSIINILSIAAFRALYRLGAYSVSKAGLDQATRSMAAELASRDVRVNSIAPGYIETPMNEEYFAGPGRDRTTARIPMGRLGKPADLDGAIIFLASDASAYVTGACIAVDGGYLA